MDCFKKKYIIICLSLFVLLCVFFSCFYFADWFGKDIYAKSISTSQPNITMYQNEYLNNFLNFIEIEPKNSNQQLEFEFSQNSKLQIDLRTYKIKGLLTGNEQLIVKTKCNQNEYISTTLNINILPQRIFATSLHFQNSTVQLYNNEVEYNNLIIEGTSVNVLPTISYSQNGIATYDYSTGKIVPISVGETTITAIINTSSTQTITANFVINVSESINKNIEIDASLSNGTNEATQIKFIRLNYELKIDGKTSSNQNIYIQIVENTIGATLEEDEYMTTLYFYTNLNGKLKLKLTSNLSDIYEKYVEIII